MNQIHTGVNSFVDHLIYAGVINKYLTTALFALAVYEYAITFDDEIKYLWRAKVSLPQVLFFLNRYLPICINLLALLLQVVENPSDDLCNKGIRTALYLNAGGIAVMQIILITRIWFLFPGENFIHIGLCLSFAISFTASFIFLYFTTQNLMIVPRVDALLFFSIRDQNIYGCMSVPPRMFWRVFIPSLILHTGLYVLTAHQAITNPQYSKTVGLRKRLLMDGGVLYLVVFCSTGLTSVGAFLTNIPEISLPAVYSSLTLITNSIAISRIILNLHSGIEGLDKSVLWENTTNGPALILPAEFDSCKLADELSKGSSWLQERILYVAGTNSGGKGETRSRNITDRPQRNINMIIGVEVDNVRLEERGDDYAETLKSLKEKHQPKDNYPMHRECREAELNTDYSHYLLERGYDEEIGLYTMYMHGTSNLKG